MNKARKIRTNQRKQIPRPMISRDQWNLPISIGDDGSYKTLRDVVNKKVSTQLFSQLSSDKKAQLVAKRIEGQKKYQIALIGPGLISKERAIQEVKAQTPIGWNLIEIEQRMIRRIMEKAKKGKSE